MKVRLGTRGSRLALVQAEAIAAGLAARGAEPEIVAIRTTGDQLAQVALADFGGKALFVKEVEEALLDGRVDVGVHSLKDMPAHLPPALCLAAFPPREDPADVLVTRDGRTLDELAAGAVVGTSSLRRRVLVLARRPDLRAEPIRGNVDTRLRKLEDGAYDAVVLARAGLVRLGVAPPGAVRLDPESFLPPPGQGVLGVEARAADRELVALLGALDDTDTRRAAEAERAYLQRLGAGCHTPVAGWARREGDAIVMRGLVASPDGRQQLTAASRGPLHQPEMVGHAVADALLAQGAQALLALGAA